MSGKPHKRTAKHSETLFHQLWSSYSQSPIPTVIIDDKGTFVAYNRAMYELTGYTLDEAPDGATILPKIFPDEKYRNMILSRFTSVLKRRKEIVREEFIITRKDGGTCSVEGSVFNVLHEGKAADLWIMQGVDITERKHAEKALRESEEQLRSLVAAAPDGIMMLDAEGTIIEVNETLARMISDQRENMVGKHFLEFISDPESRGKAELMFEVLHDSSSSLIKQLNVTTTAGSQIQLELSVAIIKGDSGTVTNFIAVVRDITERWRAEEALRDSEQKYRNLVENITDIIYAVDEKGVITYVSPPMESFIGYSPSEIIGRKFEEFIYHEDLPRVKNSFMKLSKEKTEQNEYRIITKSGEIKWIMTSSQPVFIENRFTGVRGILVDITQRKKAEEELKAAKKELEKKTMSLEETNTALKILLQHQDTEKIGMEKNILTSLRTLVSPYLEKIKIDAPDERVRTYVNIVETNLSEITKPFATQLSGNYVKLTPTEIQIANLIRENKTTKDIAKLLYISENTVFFHRKNIRHKLGLTSKKTNLGSYLRSLS